LRSMADLQGGQHAVHRAFDGRPAEQYHPVLARAPK
jgi:hypothetical protein